MIITAYVGFDILFLQFRCGIWFRPCIRFLFVLDDVQCSAWFYHRVNNIIITRIMYKAASRRGWFFGGAVIRGQDRCPAFLQRVGVGV